MTLKQKINLWVEKCSLSRSVDVLVRNSLVFIGIISIGIIFYCCPIKFENSKNTCLER